MALRHAVGELHVGALVADARIPGPERTRRDAQHHPEDDGGPEPTIALPVHRGPLLRAGPDLHNEPAPADAGLPGAPPCNAAGPTEARGGARPRCQGALTCTVYDAASVRRLVTS